MASLDAAETPAASPRIRMDEKPLSTDSMVTVRLSELKEPSASSIEPGTADQSRQSLEQELEQKTEKDSATTLEDEVEQPELEQTTEKDSETTLEDEVEQPEQIQTQDIEAASDVKDATRDSARSSQSGLEASSAASVDWEVLEKTEEQEPKDEASDESTALLLARLEQENAALTVNPKVASVRSPRMPTRPPSVQHLNKLVNGPQRQSLRYSQIPAPPMTELEFWAALVSDYVQTAQRLPTLTANKIRSGVPPPLRGVVWPSIAGANDSSLMEEFQKLVGEQSPYEGLIGKDVGRSFPNVDMFKESGGEGQLMLGRVLKCFSLYDDKIGYCQGLGFVVGPLLMHMTDAQAFCVLVRLMEHYDLRSCYLPDLSGLHLRIYQFQQLLHQHIPEVAAHLDELKVEPIYVSQWFLSFFAVTCPLPMLLRIYDVILSEGATETLMRVALSLMRRNSNKILGCREFEDVMHLLLSRSLWDTYHQQADDLVADFGSLTGLVSRSTLQTLEEGYKNAQETKALSLRATATQLLGRFWAGATHGSSKSANISLALPSQSGSGMKRSASKQSLASTLNSYSSISDAGTSVTELTAPSRKSDPSTSDSISEMERAAKNHPDRDLHSQIEDLLTALSDMQRQQADMVKELQKEREEREEDKEIARNLLSQLKSQALSVKELLGEEAESVDENDETQNLISSAEVRFSSEAHKRLSILQTKHQLRDSVDEWKTRHETEVQRCKELTQRLDSNEMEHNQLKEQLREARARIQDGLREKQRLEKTIKDLRSSKPAAPPSPSESYFETSSDNRNSVGTAPNGLREFRLGRSVTENSKAPLAQQQLPVFSKRTSSLGVGAFLAASSADTIPPQLQPLTPVAVNSPDESLLAELVSAKTAEAVARQELEEVKAKLDSLRKMFNLPANSANGGAALSRSNTNRSDVSSTMSTPVSGHGSSMSLSLPKTPMNGDSLGKSTAGLATPTSYYASAQGFFSGWGKRSVSSNVG